MSILEQEMTEVVVKVRVKPSRKTIDRSDLIGWIDRHAASIVDERAWLGSDGEPVIPNVMDEVYLQALHDVREVVLSGNFAG